MALSLYGERPSVAAMPVSPFAVFARWVAKAHAARARRTALAALLELDHCRLDDLGIDRGDILEAMQLGGASAGHKLTAARATNSRR